MPSPPDAGLTERHRERLIAAGAEVGLVDSIRFRPFTAGPFADWWATKGNALYVADDVAPPRPDLIERLTVDLIERLTLDPVEDALIVLASQTDRLLSLGVGGDRATVFVGPNCEFTAGDIYCGKDSSVVFNGDVAATRCAMVDARNGGSIVAAPDQLWAANVYIATDDMHRLEDLATGARLNPFGGRIRLGRHVWLGRDVTITGHADIGDGAVVGMRSLVRGQKIPPHTAVAGTPARVIREGVSWRKDDLP